MKSKMMRIKPEELSAMKFKEAKMILKKDLETLQTVGTEGTNFFVSTEFDFEDEKGTVMLTVGEIKGEWKKYVKTHVKPPHKGTAMGTALMDAEGTTLTLNIEKGKGKPKEIEKALKKAKLIPSSISNVVFNETPKLDADDEIDAVDEEETVTTEGSTADEEFKKVVAEAKIYKTIAADDSKARLAKIKDIDKLIADWEKKNMPVKGNATKEERNATLQKLRSQLYGHRIDINVQSRSGAEPIDAISTKWTNYKKRPTVAGTEALADMEDRVDTVADLREEIEGWLERNQAPYSKKEQELKNAIDVIVRELNTEEQRLASALPAARKAHVKAMVEKLTKATPEEKEALKKDELFMWELSRVVPVAQINDANKLLGLPPVKEEGEGSTAPKVEEREEWKDPEIQNLFKDFAKFTTFEVAVDHRANPNFKKSIKVSAGAWFWEESAGEASKSRLGSDFTFQELISEDVNGNYRIKHGDKYYYVAKTAVAGESAYKKLDEKSPLFPEAPNKNHIKQGGLGDCYLMSAITSLVAKDPNAIVDMMLDKGDSVTVRLFRVTVHPTTKVKTFAANYFNIEKSVVVNPDGTDALAHDHLWVQILEKAYAAGGFKGASYDVAATLDYKNIDSGWMAIAFEVLTGKPAERLQFHVDNPKEFAPMGIPSTERGKQDNDRSKLNQKGLPWGTAEMHLLSSMQLTKSFAHNDIFNKSSVLSMHWKLFVEKGSITQLFDREFSAKYSGQVTIEDFELLFQGKMKDADGKDIGGLPVLFPKAATAVIDWLKANKIYAGKRGSGVYSALQLDLFKSVKEALEGGKLVNVSSKSAVGRTVDGLGHSGGEKKSQGLAADHAYTVLATREVDPLKEIELRNPWGSYGQKNMKVSEKIAEIVKELKAVVKKDILDPRTVAMESRETKLNQELNELKASTKGDLVKEASAKLLNDAFLESKGKYDKIVLAYNALGTSTSFEAFKDNVTDKEAFQKSLDLLKILEKNDPKEIYSEGSDKIDGLEGGEFWLMLDDMTRRFQHLHIG